MTDPKTVNIRPEVNILAVLRHLNYRPWFALAEFVDNSIQSSIAQKDQLAKGDGAEYRLRVRIKIETENGGRIVISDNAAGIALSDFPRAFRPAQIPPETEGLSEFGMGMKSAACWFAKKWNVRTKALGDNVERTVKFDINKIVEDKIEELTIGEAPSKSQWHFTEIELTELCHVPIGRTVSKIKEHLASIYRVFIRNKSLLLEVNGDVLEYEEVPILKAAPYQDFLGEHVEWKKEIDMDFGVGQRVTGFAALREKASTTHAGFALFRRGRLIEGSADEAYRPEEIFGKTNSYSYQRLFGELNLSGFSVSHTKDGFRWEEHEEIFLELLKSELKSAPFDLLKQAEGYRAKLHKKDFTVVAERATESVAGVVQRDLAPVIEKEETNPASPLPIPTSIPKPSLSGFERTVEVPVHSTLWIITIKASTDPGIGDWLRVGDATLVSKNGVSSHAVQVDVSLVHPFVERFIGPGYDNMELFLRFASAIALAAALNSNSGVKSQYFLYFLNTLLRETFSTP